MNATALVAINTPLAPTPIGPYSQAVKVGHLVYTSGQIALNPATGELREGIDAQIDQVFTNLSEVLKASGTSFAKAVKLTIFVVDMKDFPKVNSVMEKFCQEPYPARSTVQVSALPRGALVEIEVVASL